MSLPTKLGILAGGGDLPQRVVQACHAQNIEPFVIGFQGQADPDLADIMMPIGRGGKMMEWMRARNVSDLVCVGKMHRPSLLDLRPDWKTLQFFIKVGFNRLGDNGLLVAMRETLEGEGFHIHGVHQFLPELLSDHGVMGNIKPTQAHKDDIKRGIQASQDLGRRDLGQSVIVNGDEILEEDKRGTDHLIQRAANGILVKTCKPQQDRDLDLPTIGPATVQAAYESGLSGIAVQAGATLIADKEETITLANAYGLFLIGVEI